MKIRKFILCAAAAACALAGVAQNGTMTPYSRFGLGILSDNASAAQNSMGGVGYGMNSGRQINVMNPASYARVDSLTFLFDMGADLTMLWSKETVTDASGAEKRLSDRQTGGGLGYITMQFPVSKRLGVSVGVLPFSSVGYAFGNDIDNGYASRQGAGSINQLYVGLGAKIYKGLNLGVNVAYLFGTTYNDTYAVTETGSQGLFEKQLEVRDFRINIGAQYTLPLGKDALTLGLVYTPGKKLLGNTKTIYYDLTAESDTPPAETDKFKLKDRYKLPDTYGIGLNYLMDRRLMVEADFTYQPWKDCLFDGKKGVLADRWKVSLGTQYQHAVRGGYLKRIQYRAGVFFDRDYLVVRDNNVREYGASVGFGLPVPGFKTVVSLGFGWMHRQAYPSALIKEDYFNITLGINFNEMWFRKSKIY